MQIVQASQLQSQGLELIHQVVRTGQSLFVAHDDALMVEIRPLRRLKNKNPFGIHKDTRILGDVISPLADVEWAALQ